MTVAAMKARLVDYMTGADDKKIKAIYTLLEKEINDASSYTFSESQLAVLNERETSYLSGNDKGVDRETMHNNIRNKRAANRK